jgi:Tfp pilus assembly protein PilV
MRMMTTRRKQHPESGMTLIELSIAGFVLVFGMLSIMGLLMIAVGNNGRSKIDSTATMLTQAVVEQISADLAGGGPGTVVDNANCDGTGTTFTINTTAAAPPNGNGAQLAGSTIDFTQGNPPAGFHMDYVECVNNIRTTYDVRWNVLNMMGNKTYLVTVGAKTKSTLPTKFGFAIPVNMRVYVGEYK